MSDALFLLQDYTTAEMVADIRKWKNKNKIEFRGDFQEWMAFLREEIFPNPELKEGCFKVALVLEELSHRGVKRI